MSENQVQDVAVVEAVAPVVAPVEADISSFHQMRLLARALVRATLEFGEIIKNKENNHLKTKYADLEAYIAAVRPALANQGIVLVSRTGLRSFSEQVSTVLTVTLMHEMGGTLASEVLVPPASLANPQAFGSFVQYKRRYLMAGLLNLAAEDDDGNMGRDDKSANTSTNTRPAPRQNPAQPARAAQPAKPATTPATPAKQEQPVVAPAAAATETVKAAPAAAGTVEEPKLDQAFLDRVKARIKENTIDAQLVGLTKALESASSLTRAATKTELETAGYDVQLGETVSIVKKPAAK